MITRFYTLLLVCFLSSASFAQGIDFFHGTWEEALEKSQAEGKLIFVDAYAKWCGPCKRMAAKTFPNPEVGAFFNENFIPLKIDMEAPENKTFARKYPVGSYPTLYFIDQDGEIVMREIGAKNVKGLLEIGKKAMLSNDKSGDFEEDYANGNRDAAFLLNYINALNNAGKSSLKITNEYIKEHKDLDSDAAMKIILAGCVECDSRIFDLLVKNRDKMNDLEGKEAVDKRILTACNATLKKAIEYKYVPLLDEAKQKMQAYLPEQAQDFALESDLKYASATKDKGLYLEGAKQYAKVYKKNPAKLHGLANEIIAQFPKDIALLGFAESSVKKAAAKTKEAPYYMTLASIQRSLDKNDKAIKSLQKARKLATNDPRLCTQIDSILNKLKNS